MCYRLPPVTGFSPGECREGGGVSCPCSITQARDLCLASRLPLAGFDAARCHVGEALGTRDEEGGFWLMPSWDLRLTALSPPHTDLFLALSLSVLFSLSFQTVV